MKSLIQEIIDAAVTLHEEETLARVFEFLENHQEKEPLEQMWRDARIRLEEIASAREP